MIGYIYKLTSEHCDKCYIGSTKNIKKRFSIHKSTYKYWKKNGTGYCTSFILFELGEVKMELVETFEYEDRYERDLKERFHIEANECVNKNIPVRTHKEWRSTHYAANKEQILIRKAAYYAANREQILIQQAAYQAVNKEQKKIQNAAYRAAKKAAAALI